MATIDNIVADLRKAIESAKSGKTQAYDTVATVKRVAGNTAWVQIPGGTSETPVQLTIACQPGDTVQVRVGGGRAWLTGNQSAPPTDDREAKVARSEASRAQVTASKAHEVAEEASTVAGKASATAEAAAAAAGQSMATDTLHYLATSQSSGVTVNTQGWTTTIQTIDATNKYLWTYHTYTKANGQSYNSAPVIIGTYGVDGTSVTILGSYNTLAELEAAHPTGSLGDSYMVAGDLYVWNGSAWENVGQIQGPQGAKGDKGDKGDTGETGATGARGISITKVEPQYYLSTSTSSATDGSWSGTMTYQSGRYIWTREKITFSNGNIGYSTEVYNSALTTACANALNANQIASNTNQYFWHTESGDDTGAHITEKTQEEFLADPQNGGGNTIMRSNGMAVRDGLTEVASFGGNGSQIGKTGESRLNMDYHSMKCTDNNDNIYFHVSDLRSPHTATDEFGEGFYYVDTVEYIGTGTLVGFSIPVTPRDTNYSVKVDGVEVTSGVTKRSYECVIIPAPAEGAVVTITYPVTSRVAKAYTLGMRKSNTRVGAMSVAEGLDTTASGNYAHAEGRDTVANMYSHAEGNESKATGWAAHAEGGNTVASGSDSHAEGARTTASGGIAHAEGYETQANGYCSHAQNYGTIASKEAQTVIGKYNEEDTAKNQSEQKALIIGNGTDDDNRSNAFSVDWNGNVKTAGEIRDGSNYPMPHIYVGQYNNWIYEHDVDSGLIKAWYDSGETTTTCTTPSGNGWYRNSDAYKISLAGLELDVVTYATITANAGYAYIVTSLASVTTTELLYYVGHLGSYSNRSSRIYAEVVGYKFEED